LILPDKIDIWTKIVGEEIHGNRGEIMGNKKD